MKKQPQIFMSYARADRAFAAKLARGLKKAGITAFDSANLEPGEDAFDSIRKELTASDLVVFVVPSREGEGRWALAEVGAARMLEKRILGVLPDRLRYANSGVARALSDTALVDASTLTQAALTKAVVANLHSR